MEASNQSSGISVRLSKALEVLVETLHTAKQATERLVGAVPETSVPLGEKHPVGGGPADSRVLTDTPVLGLVNELEHFTGALQAEVGAILREL
jgi:hypothetical protein